MSKIRLLREVSNETFMRYLVQNVLFNCFNFHNEADIS